MPLYFLILLKIYLTRRMNPANTSTFVRLTIRVVINKGKLISNEINNRYDCNYDSPWFFFHIILFQTYGY